MPSIYINLDNLAPRVSARQSLICACVPPRATPKGHTTLTYGLAG